MNGFRQMGVGTKGGMNIYYTFNINLFAANIYVEAPMNSQRAGGQGNGSSRGLIQSIVHSLCDV